MRASARLLLFPLLFVVGTAAPARAQTPAPDTTAPTAPTAQAADPWGFDDAASVETWGDILRPQALDLIILSVFIAFALVRAPTAYRAASFIGFKPATHQAASHSCFYHLFIFLPASCSFMWAFHSDLIT